MQLIKGVAVLLLAGLLSACATVTTGPNDLVTIDTDPPGAACTMMRDGKQIGAINPTPGSLQVPKSRKDLTVRCEREDYLPTEGTIKSDFQAATLGNIILGGLVGVAVDAASGAMNKYEAGVEITMIPESFPSEMERDEFFDRLRREVLAQHETQVTEIERSCGDESVCEKKIKEANEKRDRRLAELKAKKGDAEIVQPPS